MSDDLFVFPKASVQAFSRRIFSTSIKNIYFIRSRCYSQNIDYIIINEEKIVVKLYMNVEYEY